MLLKNLANFTFLIQTFFNLRLFLTKCLLCLHWLWGVELLFVHRMWMVPRFKQHVTEACNGQCGSLYFVVVSFSALQWFYNFRFVFDFFKLIFIAFIYLFYFYFYFFFPSFILTFFLIFIYAIIFILFSLTFFIFYLPVIPSFYFVTTF